MASVPFPRQITLDFSVVYAGKLKEFISQLQSIFSMDNKILKKLRER